MAIRTFNSVGGFSVGEIPDTIILANGDITTDFGTFTANVSAGNLKTNNLLYANGVAWTFVSAGGVDTSVQFNDGGSALGGDTLFKYNKTTTTLTANNFIATSTANLGNVGNVTIAGGTSGYVLQTNGSGALTWANPSSTGIGGANTQVQFNDGGVFGANANFSFDKTTSTLNIKNVTMEGTGTLSGGNLLSANYITGTLTTGAQPNVTSVGTLTSLNVTGTASTGNISTGNLTLTGKVQSSLLPSNDNTYDLGGTGYQWRNVYVGSNIFIGTQSYIRAIANVIYIDAGYTANNWSVGSLTSRGDADMQGNVTVAGNLTVSGTTTYINSVNLSVKDPIIDLGGANNGSNASGYDGKDRGFVLHNYKADASGPINQAFIWKTANTQFEVFSNVAYSGEVIDSANSTYGNIKAEKFIGNVSGTILTAAQPNITSLGTVTSLTISGNLEVQNTANVTTLKASGLSYPTSDGTTGQFLRTDGLGILSWQTVSTSSITNGTSNVNIGTTNGNVQIVSGGNIIANFTGNSSNFTGTMNVSGATTLGSLLIGNSTTRSVTVTTSSTSKVPLVSISSSTFRAIEYLIRGADSVGGKYSVATVSAVHDGTSIDYATYGTVNLPSSASTGNVDVTLSGGLANLNVTPSSSASTVWVVQYRTI